MTRFTRGLPPFAIAVALAAPTAATAQTTDIATLLQSTENCLAWMNNGFPDRTPFDGGFETVQRMGDEGTAIYREEDTGFEITVTRDSGMASCESTQGTVRLGPDGLEPLQVQLADRLEDGRAIQLTDGQYALCAGPAGLMSLSGTAEGRVSFLIEFGTDRALEMAGGC